MTGFLLDTNVVSEVIRPRPSAHVLEFFKQTSLEALFISDMVVAEIRYGIETSKDATRRGQLATWLREVIRPMYAGRILPLSEDTLLRWHLMLEMCRKRGAVVSEPDLILSATAAENGLTVVTRDTAPFRQLNLPVLDPWMWQS